MMIAASTAALLFAALASQTPPAQTPAPPPQPAPAAPSTSLTRDLNSGPPAPAVYLAPAPAPAPAPAITPVPRAAPPAATIPPAPPAGSVTAPPAAPTVTPPAPTPAVAPEAVVAPAPAPAPAPAAPAATVLDSAARAALPFTVELPAGFDVVTGRPGPDFRIYTIRRGEQSFVMIYAGPASQFPIYSGQMVEAGGRASILATEAGTRRALEHLFQRSTPPGEIHVWTMSLDGADRDLAERIAQSVDVR